MKETAAIMLTDIIGYTKLARHTEGTIRELTLKHKDILHTQIGDYQGRLVHMFGEQSISVFSDPVRAVKCAIDIQKAAIREPEIPLRISIHHGEIAMVEDDIIGDSVNLASRLLKKASARCVLLSEKVNAFLEEDPEIQTRSIGICSLKGVDHPVEIFGVCHDLLSLPVLTKVKPAAADDPQDSKQKGVRLLAAIMFTDMVGYTALMQEDEKQAKQNRDRHRKVLQQAIDAHQGKLLQYFGDGTLSIFNSSIEAIDCAIQIQRELLQKPVIPLRIGLHTGDIVYDDEGIYGDGVNVASRIENLAVAGSILISGKVHDDIKNHHSISTIGLGAFDLKNVKKSVEVYAISNEGLEIPMASDVRQLHRDKGKSIAILPFANFSRDPDNEFFSDGISEAIINVLAQLEGLFVTARTSSFTFKGQNKDIRELGKILGVAFILEGSVQIYKNKIRVTAQLIDTQNGFHIFSEAYDRELLDIFSIQDEIAWLIAEKLKKKIKLEKKHQAASPKTSNIDALGFYAKGIQLMRSGAHPDVLNAIKMFEAAIAIDPVFVLPYTGLCMCYTFMGAWGLMEQGESNSKAEACARQALEIDPSHPTALLVYAMSTFWISNWNLDSYAEALTKALKTAPGSAEVRLYYGVFRLMEGKKEKALTEILLARKLDPLNSVILTRLGYTYLCLKEFELAREQFREAQALVKMDMYYHFMLTWSYLLEGQYKRAEAELHKIEEGKDGYQLKRGTAGYLYARQGRTEEAFKMVEEIKRLEKEDKIKYFHLNLSLVYSGLDRKEQMYSHLKKAFNEKAITLMFIQADPFWEPYRKDAPFKALVEKAFHRKMSTA